MNVLYTEPLFRSDEAHVPCGSSIVVFNGICSYNGVYGRFCYFNSTLIFNSLLVKLLDLSTVGYPMFGY